MTRRRRKLGFSLSGSPSHHHAQAKRSAADAVTYFNKVARFTENGHCSAALAAFTRGAVDEGQTIAHQRESDTPLSMSESGKLVEAYERARRALKKACFASDLSGLRRRSRRRK